MLSVGSDSSGWKWNESSNRSQSEWFVFFFTESTLSLVEVTNEGEGEVAEERLDLL